MKDRPPCTCLTAPPTPTPQSQAHQTWDINEGSSPGPLPAHRLHPCSRGPCSALHPHLNLLPGALGPRPPGWRGSRVLPCDISGAGSPLTGSHSLPPTPKPDAAEGLIAENLATAQRWWPWPCAAAAGKVWKAAWGGGPAGTCGQAASLLVPP